MRRKARTIRILNAMTTTIKVENKYNSSKRKNLTKIMDNSTETTIMNNILSNNKKPIQTEMDMKMLNITISRKGSARDTMIVLLLFLGNLESLALKSS
jgi:hypothetical protein